MLGPRRGPGRRDIATTALACALAALATGCGSGDGVPAATPGRGTPATAPGGEDSASPPGGVTDGGFVLHVAALTVAAEEGRAGAEARGRIEELGAPAYTRAQIESFAALLRDDPERWLSLAVAVEDRVSELRTEGAASPTGAAPRPSR